MESLEKQRLLSWWRESRQNIRKGKWWLILVPIVLWLMSGLLQDRFFHSLNEYLDAHAGDLVRHIRPILTFKGPFGVAAIGVFIVLLVFLIRGYFNSRPGIVGTADLMLQELDISDLHISDRGASFEVNMALFARIQVASLDRPRTVTHFEIEMTAPDGATYSASSEYELGKYQHRHDVSKRDPWGIETVEGVREPMEDLAARLRIPIQPYTHVARAWVRFEIKAVKQVHEPKNCQFKIFAIDPSGKRHEITTDNTAVKTIEDHEFAIPK